MTLNSFLFFTLATLTGLCALAVVITQNIVRAAAWLLFALCGTAGVFFLLGADFVGATQLLVYVGGTLVLVVFGVMLTAQGPFINMKISAGEWVIGLAAGMMLFTVLAISLLSMEMSDPHTHMVAPNKWTLASMREPTRLAPSAQIGEALLGFPEATPPANVTLLGKNPKAPPILRRTRAPMAYLLVFEIVSMHLLVVLIGAAYLARAKRKAGWTARAAQEGAAPR
jgi:NADH-quinone oxidoreductase subunit J